MQTRFVCIILIIILPLTTSWIWKYGRNKINTNKRVKLQITRQRQYVIQCCSGHWSCYAAGSSGRLRTVTAQKALKTTTEQIIAEDTTLEDETIIDISSPINSDANVPITFTVTKIPTSPILSTNVVKTAPTTALSSVISTTSSTSGPSLTTTRSILTLPTTGTPPGSSASKSTSLSANTTDSTSVSTAASTSVSTAASTAANTAAGTSVSTAASTSVSTAASTSVSTAASTAANTAVSTAANTLASTSVSTAASTADSTVANTEASTAASTLASTEASTAANTLACLSSTTGSTSTSTTTWTTTSTTTTPTTTTLTTTTPTTTSTTTTLTTTTPTTTTSITTSTTTTSTTTIPATTTTTTSTTTLTTTTTPTTTTPTTTTTTLCPNACRTSECIAANNTLAAAINAIPSPTLSPSKWPLQTLNGRKYHVDMTSVGLTWYAAQAKCMKYGMKLATIGSQTEQDAITNYLQGYGANEFFIGGNKMGSQCSYVWANGEPMTYTNWNTGNPANQDIEECITLYINKWFDYPCSGPKWFICEQTP